MPKLVVRPTAAQARLIYALHENENLTLLVAEPRYVEWRGGGKYDFEWERIYGKVRMATARACIREGWIECENPEGDWNQKNSYTLSELGLEIAEGLEPSDTIPKHKGISVHDIHRALRKRYMPPEWVYLEEVRMGTGFGAYHLTGHPHSLSRSQRIDGLAINTYQSKKYRRIAFEIKIARSDFLKEVNSPDKRIAAQVVSNQFYFVAPEGIIKPDEVPDGCGLLQVRGDFVGGSVQAPWEEAAEWHPSLVASVLRSAVKQR